LASFKLRDRDAIVTGEGLISRVYGYSHPPGAYVCDPEYAPARIYKSENPRAYRARGKRVYYKFYADEGLRFVQQKYPQYVVWYPPLQRSLVGVKREQIVEARQPDSTLQSLFETQPRDALLQALRALLNILGQRLSLSRTSFGVFGSLLHNFHHPVLSDLDLIIYGREELKRLREALSAIYREDDSPLRNEFDCMGSVRGKRWKFRNYSLSEYVWHQRRKQVYALFRHKESGRTIKAEFEPVKKWKEIQNEYNASIRIQQRGWIGLLARVMNDNDAPFMPSVYQIEPVKILEGARVDHVVRVVSYVEEFRMQAQRDELVVVEGNLERVSTPKQTFHQVTLTYGPRYYEQVLRAAKNSPRESF